MIGTWKKYMAVYKHRSRKKWLISHVSGNRFYRICYVLDIKGDGDKFSTNDF